MSSRLKYRHNRDRDQHLYHEALDRLHIPYRDTSALGDGFPDLVVGLGRENFMLEIKTGKALLTVDEAKFHSTWQGRVYVVRSVYDMLYHLGLKDN